MANVTFSSPTMPRDITVYAVAGDRGTLLGLAKAHKVPIPFDCQDGDCGSCVVEVEHLDRHTRYGIALTEKEKELLRQLKKISAEEVMDAEVNDMPPRYRLACQCFVRNEDILVRFVGDETAPSKPSLSLAAAIYKGGLKIESLDQFLNYAVQVEQDAAEHFEALAARMEACGNTDVAELFSQLGRYSRMHLDEAKARSARHDVPLDLPPHTAWPNLETPEQTALWAGDPQLSRADALKAALHGERRGYEFYYAVAETTKDKAIKKVAKEFVREEAEHVDTLKLWIDREDARNRAAS